MRHRPENLWRALLGAVLRERRRDLDRTLAQVAARAGVSVQYLSEVERGLKDPSSEVISAIAGALGLTLVDLTRAVGDLAAADQRRVALLEVRSATAVRSLSTVRSVPTARSVSTARAVSTERSVSAVRAVSAAGSVSTAGSASSLQSVSTLHSAAELDLQTCWAASVELTLAA